MPSILEYDFQESPGHWICLTSHIYQRLMNEELAPHGVTFRQCQILCWLALDGDLSQVELAQRMNIEPPTLVGVLDRMEADGLLIRRPSPEDRRRNVITVSSKAKPVWEKIVACARKIRARAVQGMTPEQLQSLKELLAIVRRNISESPPGMDP